MGVNRLDRVKPVVSLQEFFKNSVAEAMARQGLRADDHTEFYVVNLLTLFARSEAFFETTNNGVGLRPLAVILAEAAEASSTEKRNMALQRIGDVSLFIAGFFSEGLARKLVDVDYYVYMGGSAYHSLADNVRGTLRGRVFSSVFAELAEKFQDFVDVLNEVREEAKGGEHLDVLRLYEVWLRTGSQRAARLLRRLGVEPNQALDVDTRH